MLVLCFVVSGSAISRNFTHYVCLCVCLHVRDMYAICMRQRGHFTLKAAGTSTHCMPAAARALSLFHSQGQYRAICPDLSGFGTSQTNVGDLIHQIVDLKKFEY